MTMVCIFSDSLQDELPMWTLYNLLGLYWRAEGSATISVECLRKAIALTPNDYLDVPYVNLASVLYKAGHIDDALKVALKAIQINHTEVS